MDNEFQNWTLWRVWNQKIQKNIEENIQFGGKLYGKTGIIKMISDYFSCFKNVINPIDLTDEYILVEIISKSIKIQRCTKKRYINILAREIQFVENCSLSEEQKFYRINIFTDLGTTFNEATKMGDLFMFSGIFGKSKITNCNHSHSYNNTEASYIIFHKIEENVSKKAQENLGDHLIQKNYTNCEHPNALAQKLTIPIECIPFAGYCLLENDEIEEIETDTPPGPSQRELNEIQKTPNTPTPINQIVTDLEEVELGSVLVEESCIIHEDQELNERVVETPVQLSRTPRRSILNVNSNSSKDDVSFQSQSQDSVLSNSSTKSSTRTVISKNSNKNQMHDNVIEKDQDLSQRLSDSQNGQVENNSEREGEETEEDRLENERKNLPNPKMFAATQIDDSNLLYDELYGEEITIAGNGPIENVENNENFQQQANEALAFEDLDFKNPLLKMSEVTKETKGFDFECQFVDWQMGDKLVIRVTDNTFPTFHTKVFLNQDNILFTQAGENTQFLQNIDSNIDIWIEDKGVSSVCELLEEHNKLIIRNLQVKKEFAKNEEGFGYEYYLFLEKGNSSLKKIILQNSKDDDEVSVESDVTEPINREEHESLNISDSDLRNVTPLPNSNKSKDSSSVYYSAQPIASTSAPVASTSSFASAVSLSNLTNKEDEDFMNKFEEMKIKPCYIKLNRIDQ